MSLKEDFLEWREDYQSIVPNLESLEVCESESDGKAMLVCLFGETMASRARKAEREEPFIYGVSVFYRCEDEQGFCSCPTLCEPFHCEDDARDYIKELKKVL